MTNSTTNNVDSADLDRFIKAVELQLTFNLPEVADQLNLPWNDVKRQLLHNEKFRDALREVYERWKYRAMQTIAQEVGGSPTGAKLPPVGMIKLMFDIIDEEIVLGRVPGQKDDAGVTSEADEAALREKLGL